jgi:photosystem II stability/assembly factor-like uncharacterized protein
MRQRVTATGFALVLALISFRIAADFAPTERHVQDPSRARKSERMRGDDPRAGYPGEAFAWYFEQRAIPAGVIPADWKERALAHISAYNQPGTPMAPSSLGWIALGPNNIGGRVRSIAADPVNANILYAGSVSGGVFKSTNAGTSWFPTDDFAANLSISSIVIDPSNPAVLYAGTGEGMYNVDAVRGAGVLKSTNAGTSWTLQTGFTGGSGFPYYINDLYLRPDSTSKIYAATNVGLFRTTNGGASWAFLHQGTSARATQIVEHPVNRATFFVCYGNFSTDGIYRTTNGGASFTKLTTGLPATGYTRIAMAISPSNPQTLYAVFNSTSNTTRGVFRSTNGGTSWDSLAIPRDALTNATHLAGQGWYNNAIAVDPVNPAIVYVGGVNLYKSTTSGAFWTMISNWYAGAGYPYVHADQHELLFTGGALLIGNDGGVFRTTNGGTSFTDLNTNFATAQFYSGAVHPSSDLFIGGTQDNGTLRTGVIPAWSMVFGGDGGATFIDFLTPSIMWTEYVRLNIQKSTNGGTSWLKTMNGIPSGPGQSDGTTDRVLFIAPIAMDPTDPQRLAAGTYRAYYTSNGGSSWIPAGGDLTGDGVGASGSTISALAIAKTSSATLYAGTSGSLSPTRIQVTTNTGTLWTNVTINPLPNRYVTRIVIDPNDAGRAWALFSGYDANTPSSPGHVFLTTNRGTTWTNRSGNLPDLPVNAGVVNPANQNHLVVGTDLGIFETLNGGTTWIQQNSGLANVQVADLDQRQSDGILVAATHGRGMFRTSGPLTAVPPGPAAATPAEFGLMQNYPNPFNPATTIRFTIAGQGDHTGTLHATSLQVFDVRGRQVATLVDEAKAPGQYAVRWDASGAASGVYFYRLMVGERSVVRKMVVTK